MAPLWKLLVAVAALKLLTPLGAVTMLSVAHRFGLEAHNPFRGNTIYGRPLDGDHTATGARWGFVVFGLSVLVSLVASVALVTVVLGL